MLEIQGVFKTFNAGTPNEVRALRGVDLTIDEGSFVIVIGTNGSGKSTLLNAIAGGFLARRRHADARRHGRSRRWPEHRRAALIGRVFQNPFSGTAPSMSIAENLALAARRGRPRGLGWALSKSMRREFRDRVRRLNMGLEGAPGQSDRHAVGRSAAGADAADGVVAASRSCCCSTSTRRRSIPRAPIRSFA